MCVISFTRLGFGDNFVKWVKVLLNAVKSWVVTMVCRLVFDLERDTRQGDHSGVRNSVYESQE